MSKALKNKVKLNDIVSLDDFGADGTIAGDSAALKAAIAYAAARWLPIVLPARRIYWDGTVITADKVRLWGSGMPMVNTSRTSLVGGTIIEGKLIFTGNYLDLRDYGVDLGTAGAGPDADGIKCTSTTYNSGEFLNIENLVGLCKNKTSAFHALLFEGYKKVTGGNLYGVNGYFGCVIKCQGVQLSSIHTDNNNDTGLYLKSDNTYGICSNLQIDKVRAIGASTMGVRVQADSAPMVNVQLNDVYVTGSDRSLCVQLLDFSGASLKKVDIGKLLSESAVTADLSVLSLRSGESVDSVNVGSIVAINGTGKAVETSCQPGATVRNLTVKRVYASYPAGASQATMDSAVFVANGVLSTDFGSVEVVENYGAGSKIGALNYQNTSDPKYNILGSHRCKVIGSGRPLPGNLNQNLSGATATLQIPENITGDGVSFCRVTIPANATITTFTPELSTQTFNLGHLLFILNNSGFTLSVAHNVGQGILNQSGATVNIAGNEVAAWVHIGGGIWSQLKIA